MFSNGVNEALGVCSQKEDILIFAVYRQPDDSRNGHKSAHDEFKQMLNEIQATIRGIPGKSPDIIVCGDFNMPHVKWLDGVVHSSASTDEKTMFNALKEFMNEFFLNQIIHKPTHKDGNVLDLILTNNTDLMHSYHCIPTLNQISHHFIVEVASTYNTSFHTESKNKILDESLNMYNYFDKSIKWEELNHTLINQNWTLEYNDMHPLQNFNKFLSICTELSEKHVTKRKIPQEKKKSIPPKERRILMRKRSKIQSKLKNTSNKVKALKLKDRLVQIERELQDSYRKKALYDERNAIKAIKQNSKYFFSYAKKFSKIKSKVGPLLRDNGDYTSDSKEMADLLQDQYQSVFSTPKSNEPLVIDQTIGGLNDIAFTISDIVEAIDEISATSAPGPDGFSAVFLKKCRDAVAKPLYLIWRRFFDDGITPYMLRLSYVLGGIKAFRKKHSNISRIYCCNITSDWLIYFQPIRFSEMIKLISRQPEDNFHNT